MKGFAAGVVAGLAIAMTTTGMANTGGHARSGPCAAWVGQCFVMKNARGRLSTAIVPAVDLRCALYPGYPGVDVPTKFVCGRDSTPVIKPCINGRYGSLEVAILKWSMSLHAAGYCNPNAGREGGVAHLGPRTKDWPRNP